MLRQNVVFYRILEYCIMERITKIIQKHKWVVLLVCVTLGIVSVMLVRALWDPARDEVREGTVYLEKLENKDLAAVEAEVKEVKRKAQDEAIEAGELSIWAQFSDYALFGDSRTVGFSSYEFLDKQRVLAERGLTIADISAYEDQMVALNPSCLFLCTGLNDVASGYWKTPEEYVAAYEETVQELMKMLPDTEIYINSIFPAQAPAFEKNENEREIPEYNEAVKQWCEEKGYHYIDNTSVYEKYNDLYEEDGIHFKKEFYQYWAANMLAEVE